MQRANAAIRRALTDKDTIDGLAAMGVEVKSSTPEELAALLKADNERWGPIVKRLASPPSRKPMALPHQP